ncbi:MAG: putative peptidoglycan binding domain [Pseudomonadota bacterium]|jgi:peptidoglycan hydrolase-like protein with peptidoglycan-binding domain
MSKFQIRSPLLITAALALTPAIAFAGGDPSRHDGPTTTTTTTTAPSDKASTSSVTSPTGIPSEIQQANRAGVAPPAEPSIDSSQVQRVFGMDVSLIDLKSLSKEQAKQLQQRLSERGFYRGKVDGVMGPQTKNALSGLMAQQFALNQRLVSQGQITEQFASSMGVDTIGRAPVSGVDTAAPSQAPRASEASPRANEPSPPPPVSEPATRNAAPPSVPPNQ